ncbi:MAG: excinuclease ABC subunit UvrC [Planctomycetes bacterium]|nr:excinuclease ABC subunit UvrC [Planctomycetota bacterium]
MHPQIVDKVARFPDGPGIYLFLGERGKVLYVGKAANLRARVRSYLKPGGDGRYQLRFLEDEAQDVEFVATANEQDALLLESSVIKQRQPRYNLKLKDDKSFLLLRLDLKEPWPWYRLVRKRRDDGALYFGPYTSAKTVRRTLRLLHKIAPLRDCTDPVFRNRSRPCIKYQLGRCPAPCTGLIEKSGYDELLQRSLRILRGDTQTLQKDLRAQMSLAASTLQFERAQTLKLQLEALQMVGERQAALGGDEDEDVFGMHRVGEELTVAFLSFRSGAMASCRRFSFRSSLPNELVIGDLLSRLYEGDVYVPPRVLVSTAPVEGELIAAWLTHKRGSAVLVLVPQRGGKRRHLELALQNAQLADALQADIDARLRGGAKRLAEMLQLPETPVRLHCLDVSTTQGVATVASRVCFVDGAPYKAAYRLFRISEEHAGDDFSAMEEAVRRSVLLCLERDDDELPDLLIVDGGDGQLAAACRALKELGLEDDVPICGLAKSRLRGLQDQRRETGERIFQRSGAPILLGKSDPETLLLAAIRDEAHRTAIRFHKKRRGSITNILHDIPGLGPSRRRIVLSHFGSLAAVRRASLDELRAVPGIPPLVAVAVHQRVRSSEP